MLDYTVATVIRKKKKILNFLIMQISDKMWSASSKTKLLEKLYFLLDNVIVQIEKIMQSFIGLVGLVFVSPECSSERDYVITDSVRSM